MKPLRKTRLISRSFAFSSASLASLASIAALLLTACGGGGESASDEVTIPDEPAAAIETILTEFAAGNGGILWDALPTSYQTDVNGIAQLAGQKVDAELYNKSFALVRRLGEVADKQKEFILNTQLGGGSDEAQKARVEAAWPSIIGFVDTLTSSSLASVEGLQAFDGAAFAETTMSKVAGYMDDLAALNEEPNPLELVSVEVLESAEGIVNLAMTTSDGGVEEGEFTQVEGRWLPTEMVTDWNDSIAQARAELEAISAEAIAQTKPQMLGILTTVEGVLTQIEAAETQEQFDQALQGAMMPLMGLMMMQQGMGGGQPAPPMPTAP